MKYIRFKKEDKLWYLDLSYYQEEDLLMVRGTDKMLEDLSNGKDSVVLRVSTNPFRGALHLEKIDDLGQGGAIYLLKGNLETVWFGKMLLDLYHRYPNNLYFQKI